MKLHLRAGLCVGIILRLRVPKLSIFAAGLRQQRFMRAVLGDLSLVEHQNFVAEAAGGQPVTDLDRGASAGDVTEAAVHLILRHRIQRRRWVRPAT